MLKHIVTLGNLILICSIHKADILTEKTNYLTNGVTRLMMRDGYNRR